MMAQNRVDVLVLQECRSLPTQTELPGFHQHENLGMCLLSRFPVTEVADRDRKDVWEADGSGAIVRYTLDAGWGAFTLTNVHLETPREGFEAFFDADVGSGVATLTAKNAQRYAEAQLAFEWTHRGAPLPRLVAGDFNTPAQSDLLRETWSDYDDCFGVTGYGYGHTKETRLLGVRIDNILASQEWSCVATEVLDGFQSDHRPVVAEVQLKAD
jgi:vancomycin resistance protein VanJ